MQLVVGRIRRAHGVLGEVAVEVRTDDPARRFAPGALLATEPTEVGPLTVRATREHAGGLLVTFLGVSDRTAANALRGVRLLADSSTSPASAGPDEFWDHELVGLRAVSVDGEQLGAVQEVLHSTAGDLLSVRRPDGAELLVPFVAAIVPEVDVAGGRVLVDPPPGLLDLSSG